PALLDGTCFGEIRFLNRLRWRVSAADPDCPSSPHLRSSARWSSMSPAALGVNYTPRKGWFHSWSDLDPSAVDEDLAQIAALGLDHVRIFPLWPVLQPRSEEHTSELQSRFDLVCRLLLAKENVAAAL